MLLTQFGTWLLMGVVEEKSSRVIEVLLSTLRPAQLLAGKVIGIGAVGLLQAALIVAVALGLGAAEGSTLVHGTAALEVVSALLWVVLGYAFYCWVYAAGGSLADRQEQVQSLAFPLQLPLLFGYIVSFTALGSGQPSELVKVLAYLPPTAPFAMPVLVGLGDVSWWGFTVSVALMLVATVGVARLASTVYRRAILRTGGRVHVRELFSPRHLAVGGLQQRPVHQNEGVPVPGADAPSPDFVPVTDVRPDDVVWPAMSWPPAPDTVLVGRFVEAAPADPGRDAPELFEALEDDRVWEHVPFRPSGPDALAEHLSGRAGTGMFPWVVRLRVPYRGLAARSVVGTSCYLDVSVGDARLEIGATLYRHSMWATAVNPDTKLLLLRYAFEALHVGRVQLKTDVRNTRSQRAIARLGARYEGTLGRYQRRADGTVRDTVLFSVLAEDWPRVRGGLEQRVAGAPTQESPKGPKPTADIPISRVEQ